LWPLIRGELVPDKVALIEHAGKNQVALRSRRYKYIKHLETKNLQPSYPFVAGKEELYDLAVDPREEDNLVHSRSDLLWRFRKELRVRQKDKFSLRVGKSDLSPETVEVLRSLGYIQ
jgi:arylsulfatase A-like enzyme